MSRIKLIGIVIAKVKIGNGELEKMVNKSNILENEVLLNFISRDAVAWTLVKVYSACKYVGLFV